MKEMVIHNTGLVNYPFHKLFDQIICLFSKFQIRQKLLLEQLVVTSQIGRTSHYQTAGHVGLFVGGRLVDRCNMKWGIQSFVELASGFFVYGF